MKPCVIAAMFIGLFGAWSWAQTPIYRNPVKLGPPVADSYTGPSISGDGLTIYWNSKRTGSQGKDIWMAQRSDLTRPWGTARPITELRVVDSWTQPSNEGSPDVTDDELAIVFVCNVPVEHCLYMATRVSRSTVWGKPQRLLIPSADSDPCISGDGLELFFFDGNEFILRVARPNRLSTWSSPTILKELKTASGYYRDHSPAISGDGLTLYFSSTRTGGGGGGHLDLWFATRKSRNAKFGVPVPLSSLNSIHNEQMGDQSSDGFSFYFISDDTYRADRVLPVCIPIGQPTRGKPFDIACRRDPGDTGIVIGSLWKIPLIKIPGAQGMVNINPSGIIWQAVGAVGNMGRFTTRLPTPNIAALRGIPLHWQAAAQAPPKIYISPLVTTVIQ